MSIFSQVKEKIEAKRYKNYVDKIVAWINDALQNETSFDVPYQVVDGQIEVKTISPDNFNAAFHMDVWNNMTPQEQIVALIWYESKQAKVQNRPRMSFSINPNTQSYSFYVDDQSEFIVLSVPIYAFEANLISSYEHLSNVAKIGIVTRDAYYSSNQKDQNKLGEFYASVADIFIKQPEQSYKKLIVQNTKNQYTKEEQQKNKPYFFSITKEEQEELLLYFLHPRWQVSNNIVENIIAMGDTNVHYLGEDYNFEQYKQLVQNNKQICNAFIKEQVKEQAKEQLFLSILEKTPIKEEEYEN
jgi:hypothetical protein